MELGIRELRDGLSRHLALVRQGHVVTVTDHGKPVARIVPVDALDPLDQLVRDGLVTPATRRSERPDTVKAAGIVSDLVAEQRR